MASVGIIGGGVAGLALAGLLARRGHAVSVYERDELGGKLRRIHVAGQAIDTGPSLFTFPSVWRRVLDRLGEPDGPELVPLPNLGVHVVDGQHLPLPVPAGHPLHAEWTRYEDETARLAPHVEELLITPPSFTDARFLRASAAVGGVLGRHLTAERWLRSRRYPPVLQHVIATHALNAGLGPHRATALYALLPGMIARHVAHPTGGMFTLVDTLVAAARRHGVELCTGAEVTALNAARGELHFKEGVRRHDLLVSALDPTRLGGLLGRRVRPQQLSVSGVALYAVSRTDLPLAVTTVVPPASFAAFEQAMMVRAWPTDTLALIHHDAPRRVLSVLLTAPPGGRDMDVEHPWLQGQLRRLERQLQLQLRSELRDAVALTPAFFALGGATGGAIYGRVHPPWRSGPFHPEPYRLSSRLWQVGGGVHPGGGLPGVLGGALIVDELLAGDFRRSR